jgi:tripartite-type tricarboxylate transporter receptor subunit TctC
MDRREAILTMLALGATPLSSNAEQFPKKPLSLICPWSAGGSADLALRALAESVGKLLGQPMIVEYKPGASGTMGATAMVSARPDGYTLTQIPGPVFRLPHMQKVGFDPRTDLTYIICLTGYTYGVVVRADSPWKTFQDVINWAKANPGKLAYGSPGVGSNPHIGMELIAEKVGAQFLHIPFKGVAENLQSLLGGHTMLLADTTGWASQVNDGRARLLVTWGAERTKSWPEVPILKELGIDIVYSGPWGIAGPRGMDPQVVKILHDAFQKATNDANVLQTLKRLDQSIVYMNGAEYADFARRQFDREKVIVEKFGLRGQS